jgi:hypothetical protein
MNAIFARLLIALTGALAFPAAAQQLSPARALGEKVVARELAQVKRYDTLRGYSGGTTHQHRKH